MKVWTTLHQAADAIKKGMLIDKLEQDDRVTVLYHKLLLYLVSNAFEKEKQAPLLGMQKFNAGLQKVANMPKIYYSDGVKGTITHSTTHGGFDNDVLTMNHILKRVLGVSASYPFKSEDLEY